MATVKLTLIPITVSKYFDKALSEPRCPKTYCERLEFIKWHRLEYVIEQLDDFEPRLKFKIKKGIIEFETNKPCDDLRILFGHFIMNEVEKIEIVRN